MNSYFKKIISVILAAVLTVTAFAVPSYAAENQEEQQTQEKAVARLSVCSCIYFFPIAGHEWIYVENLTDETLTVGLYEVPAGEGVSIGSFSFSVSDGWGLYYNVEAFRENRDDNLDSCWSITEEITAAQAEKLTEELIGYSNAWSFYYNCMFFAFSIWNSVTGDLLIPLIIPALGQAQVMLHGGKKGKLTMYEPSSDRVYRQKGVGQNAYLVPVSEATIKQ